MSIDIDNIKHNYPIVEVARRLQIDVLNNNTCRCANPSHEDLHPSMSFHVAANTFKCFSCGVSGSNIDLVILVQGGDFKSAVEFITSQKMFDNYKTTGKKRSLYKEPRENREQNYNNYNNNSLLNNTNNTNYNQGYDNEKSKLYKDFIKMLSGYKAEAKTYLKNRGFNDNIIERYPITTLPKDFSTQTEILNVLRNSYSDHVLTESGLYRFSQKGELYNAFFAHRLLIPYTKSGEIITIQGRSIDKSDVRSKYIFLKGSHSAIFNVDLLEKLKNDSSIIITEGVFNCLSWQALGFDAIAIGSSSNISRIDLEILNELRRLKIFMAGDSDAAGHQMNEKLEKLLDCNHIVKYQSIDLESVARAFHISDPSRMNDINDILTNINFEMDKLDSLGIVKYARYNDKILFLGYATIDEREIRALKNNADLIRLLKFKKAFDGDVTLL